MTLIILSALLNILLAIWLLRTRSDNARLRRENSDQRIELRLKGHVSTYAKELMPGLRESGL